MITGAGREIGAKLDQKELKKSGIFVYPNIPPDASTRAVNRFGAGITEDDVLVLANTAAFKSGNEGLIISAEALYSSELEAPPAQHIKFCRIDSVDFKSTFWTKRLVINGAYFGPNMHEHVGLKFIADSLFHVVEKFSDLNEQIRADPSTSDIGERLRELKRLHDDGVITSEEYEEVRERYISKL